MYTGALTETISLTYNEPTDVFASLTVLGKSRGPLFQDIYTSGVTTRDISIDAIIKVINIILKSFNITIFIINTISIFILLF